MTIQQYEEVPAVCKNKQCDNYKGFELVAIEDITRGEDGKDYVLCDYCKQPIFID